MASVKFAVVDVNDYLSKKQAAEPDLAADWAQLEELYNKKLWHQLTLKLLEFVKHPSLQKGDNLIQLYSNFLSIFENKINPLSLVEIVAFIVEQYTNKKDAITFLEKVETKVKMNDEALALCKVLQGQIYLEQLNDLDATEKIIEQLEGTLEDADGVTPVHGRFYKLASEYYRVRGPMAKYYRAALRYVGCEKGGAALPLEVRRATALRLALAGVIAPTVYDLGELLAHPILESLEGTPEAWACELVKAVAAGDIVAFEKIRAQAPNPELHRADRQLRQKIAILCLMEMAFNRTSAQRKLTFSEIAREARVPHDEVELLVMKALAEKLVRGHIDQLLIDTGLFVFRATEITLYEAEISRLSLSKDRCAIFIAGYCTNADRVSETVTVSWVRARAVGRAGAGALARRLDAWCAAAAAATALLHATAPDLLTY